MMRAEAPDGATLPSAKRISHHQALAAAVRCADLLTVRFGATRVVPFGSVRDPGAWHAASDLDLAVEGIAPEQFFQAWSSLYSVLPSGLEVDLVALENTYPELRARILGEVAMPEDPLLGLHTVVNDELVALQRIVNAVQEALTQIDDPPGQLDMNGLASYLHQFYTGCERILERIALQLDGKLPEGAYSHANLLARLTQQTAAGRPLGPAVLTDDLWLQLQEYLSFRHFFRHAYGFLLEWEKLQPLIERLPNVLTEFHHQIDAFCNEILKGNA
jgi:predicted nucleotidyltransferase